MAVPSQRKPPKVESDEQFSDEEAMRRTNEVVKRMIETPPKRHSEMELGKRKAKSGNSAPKRSAKKDAANPGGVS